MTHPFGGVCMAALHAGRAWHAWLPAVIVVLAARPAALPAQEKAGDTQPDGLKNLHHPEAIVRYRTAAVLARQGPQAKFAIEELHEALNDPDPLVRVKVAEAIWKVERPGASAVLPTLQRALKEKDAAARAAACGVIGMMGAKGKAAVPALTEALRDKDLSVVFAAIDALGEIGPAAHAAAPALLGLCGFADFVFLEPLVAASLGAMGDAVVPELIAALADPSLERRRVAAYALGSMGADAVGAVKALAKALRDEQPHVRIFAARALGNIGKAAQAALPRLRDATADPEPLVCIGAALAVWQVAADPQYVPLVTARLADATLLVREDACHALAVIGPGARSATDALARALKDPEPRVRKGAAEALGRIGPPAASTAGTLRPLLRDPDKSVRPAAAFALWQLTGQSKDALDALRPLLADDDSLRSAAAEKLGAMGVAARDTLADLVRLYRTEDNDAVRGVVAAAIQRIDPGLAGKLGIHTAPERLP